MLFVVFVHGPGQLLQAKSWNVPPLLVRPGSRVLLVPAGVERDDDADQSHDQTDFEEATHLSTGLGRLGFWPFYLSFLRLQAGEDANGECLQSIMGLVEVDARTPGERANGILVMCAIRRSPVRCANEHCREQPAAPSPVPSGGNSGGGA